MEIAAKGRWLRCPEPEVKKLGRSEVRRKPPFFPLCKRGKEGVFLLP
jgi:hypothetical protein